LLKHQKIKNTTIVRLLVPHVAVAVVVVVAVVVAAVVEVDCVVV
jgi:hypothetical protein